MQPEFVGYNGSESLTFGIRHRAGHVMDHVRLCIIARLAHESLRREAGRASAARIVEAVHAATGAGDVAGVEFVEAHNTFILLTSFTILFNRSSVCCFFAGK